MALKVDLKDLPKAEEVEKAKPHLKKLVTRLAKLEKVTAAVTKDGVVDSTDKKLRSAKKKVKRTQRAIREEQKLAAIAAKKASKKKDAAAA